MRAFGAVSIEGPMWCGKIWLGLNVSESSFEIGGIDEYGQNNRDLVEMNVRIAMEGKEPHLIDEWQEIPTLWDAGQMDFQCIDRPFMTAVFPYYRSFSPTDLLSDAVRH